MKKRKVIFLIILVIVATVFYLNRKSNTESKAVENMYKSENGISYISKMDKDYVYIYKDGEFQKEFIKGINLGSGKPGAFPGELAITKQQYKKWLIQIGEMNVNSIRVYTILKPEFYEAFYEYNKEAKSPIYLFQGVWINEDDLFKINDAHDSVIKEGFKNDIKSAIDIIHGNSILPKKPGFAYGVYEKDISSYVLGFIMGLEWDPSFIINTNQKNSNKTSFQGKYLYTENSSPFESFLCEALDYAADYETDKYKSQRALSTINWPTTDVLNHPNEPYINEDSVSLNVENIKKRDNFLPGLFASYHIYPYYPDFMVYDKKYSSFKDENGKINTYKAYLKDIKKEHTMPIIVAEFGVPSSRGITHENEYTGQNQGFIEETEQGEMDKSMLNDIFDEKYAGAIVFTWQDEWFKRTWNTMNLDIPGRRPYWGNAQTNEQQFGVLSFDGGEGTPPCQVDGDTSEWKDEKPITEGEGLKVYVKSDEKYLYIMADSKDISGNTLLLPIDTIENQGLNNFTGLNASFDKGADFVILIDGENSKILVHSIYDVFNFEYYNKEFIQSKEDKFNPIYLCINREMYLPEDKITVPLKKVETGKLKIGNGNPKSEEYNSLTDYSIKEDKIEIRIPWAILNVMDPSTKMIMGDLRKGKITPIEIKGIAVGGNIIKDGKEISKANMNMYSYEKWDLPKYNERLKKSYYILQDAFKNIEVR